jgi:WD40 repeat protein
MLMSNSGDYEQLYWDLSGKQVMGDVRDKKWDTWTCVLGFEVMGIWQDGMDGTDYNALHRSHGAGDASTGSYCVGSTDDGLVRLFNYPVVVEKAPHHAFRGHSSHVQNVRFLADDARVVSAGGRDGSMMQWTTHGITKPSKSAALMKTVKTSKKKLAPKRGSPIRRRGQPDAVAAAGPRQMSMEELQKEEALNRAMLKQKDKEINKLKARLGKQSKAIRE